MREQSYVHGSSCLYQCWNNLQNSGYFIIFNLQWRNLIVFAVSFCKFVFLFSQLWFQSRFPTKKCKCVCLRITLRIKYSCSVHKFCKKKKPLLFPHLALVNFPVNSIPLLISQTGRGNLVHVIILCICVCVCSKAV